MDQITKEKSANIRLRLLSYVVIVYMLFAFSWWSVLLFIKNRDAFTAKTELLRIGMVAERIYENEAHFVRTPQYQALDEKYKRQEWMIFGEASVFIVSLIVGIWLINRGYNKEMNAAIQRRNFLLSITHELKSPIASIQLVLETLVKRSLDKEQINKLGSSAIKEATRLNELVNNLLLSAKLETAYTPYFEPIELSELVGELATKLQEKYPHVRFHMELSSVSLMELDKMGMTSVVINLLENAIKYSTEAPEIWVHLLEKDKKAVLEIADNGIGIKPKDKSRIFEKFYRAGNEDTRQTKGTGLGLYIVSQIILAHQGKIKVLDNQPRGSIFHIELPLELNNKIRFK